MLSVGNVWSSFRRLLEEAASTHSGQISEQCHDVIRVAEPVDAFDTFKQDLAESQMAQQIARIEAAFGLQVSVCNC